MRINKDNFKLLRVGMSFKMVCEGSQFGLVKQEIRDVFEDYGLMIQSILIPGHIRKTSSFYSSMENSEQDGVISLNN